MSGITHSPPQSVALVYRVVGKTHVFASDNLRGLVHVGSHDRETAFNDVISALNDHVTNAYKCEAAYRCETTYEEFCEHLDAENDLAGAFISLTLDRPEQHCH